MLQHNILGQFLINSSIICWQVYDQNFEKKKEKQYFIFGNIWSLFSLIKIQLTVLKMLLYETAQEPNYMDHQGVCCY